MRFAALVLVWIAIGAMSGTAAGQENVKGATATMAERLAAFDTENLPAGTSARRLLVGFKSRLGVQAAVNAHAQVGAKRVRGYALRPIDMVEIPAAMTLKEAAARYLRMPEVSFVEPDYPVHALAIPNDPRFGELWGLRNTGQSGGTAGVDIGITQVWDTAVGSRDIIVGVIDTGVDYTHPDLVANMWTNTAELNGLPGVDDDGNGIIDDIHGAKWVNGVATGNPMDDHYHGTHVAGTIGATGNNGVGVVGVNHQVRIMALKFLNADGSGSTSDAAFALEYAILKGAHLTNNSWGGGGYSQTMKNMIDAAAAAGQLFVAAAGNESLNVEEIPNYPSSYASENIVAVASSDRYDARSGFSNYGAVNVDLAAPGSSILSTLPGNTYGLLSGTSMATPHVAGVVALLLSEYPDASWMELKRWLLDGGTPLRDWEGVTATGTRLSAPESLRLAGLPVNVHPITNFTAGSRQNATSVDLTWSNPLAGGLQGVVIRRQTGSYPLSWNDGTLVYSGTGNAATDNGLTVGTLYYYTAWAHYGGSLYSSRAIATARAGHEEIDHFTEAFTANDNDLDYRSITFYPDESPHGYMASTSSIAAFPVSPTGSVILNLDDDDFGVVALADGKQILLHGQAYSTAYVGSNGYVTFTAGSDDYNASIQEHFELPGISMLRLDLTPASNVGYRQLADRLAITFVNVTEYDMNNRNSMQLELFFNGIIRLSYLNIDAVGGVAGLSAGGGMPLDFTESDLSRYNAFLTPRDGFRALGYAGGPFEPSCREYVVRNPGSTALNWAAGANQPWVSITPSSGVLQPGQEQAVQLCIGAAANALAPGSYPANVTFTPGGGLTAVTFSVILDVVAIPGNLIVEDSILPTDDRNLPFGTLDLNQSRSETVTLRNTDAVHPIIVDSISLSPSSVFSLAEAPVLPLNLAPGASVAFDVIFAPLEAADVGPHQASLVIAGNDADEPVITLVILGTVAADPLQVTPTDPFLAVGPVGGPFTPSSRTYLLTNASASQTMQWTADASTSWVTLSRTSGSLAPGTSVQVSVGFSAPSLPAGVHLATVRVCNATTSVTTERAVRLAVGNQLCEAVDACELTWVTGGNANWFPQTAITHDGIDAAQSGVIAHSQSTYIQTTVLGPGTLTFWWKASSESGYDKLSFYRNGTFETSISGDAAWAQKSYEIGEGSHTLKWEYRKDGSLSRNSDCGWLDQVAYLPDTLPGEIGVTDSILPADDLRMPFGTIGLNQEKTETLTLRNMDATNDLIVDSILLAHYGEDFEDGVAQDWVPRTGGAWSVANGEYRATASVDTYMQSNYTGGIWSDLSCRAAFRRTGRQSTAAGIVIRASNDFVWDPTVGTAYGVAIAADTSYWVGRFSGGKLTFLTDGWVESPYLRTGTATNEVIFSADGSNLRVYFNGYLAWSGSDSSIPGPGRTGLIAYNKGSDPTVHLIDNVMVAPPVAPGGALVGDAQAWYNARPFSTDPSTFGDAPARKEELVYPVALLTEAPDLVLSPSPFRLASVPLLPLTLSPGQAVEVQVIFSPPAEEVYSSTLLIECNDASRPRIAVDLTGTGEVAIPYLSVANQGIMEGDEGITVLSFPVTLSAPSESVVSVEYATVAGTATSGIDYHDGSGTLVIPVGEMSGMISIDVVGDLVIEGDETFHLTLTNLVGAAAADMQAVGTILNDDVPRVSVSNASALEGGALTFTLSLDRPSPFAGSADYATVSGTATAGSDYTSTSGTATFAANQITATVVVQSLHDELHEGDETFTLTLSNPTMLSLGEAVGIGTIEDDDEPWLRLSLAAAAISEDVGTTVATVTRNTNTGAQLVADLTSSDTTEAVVQATVTIAAGSSTATFAVNAVNDDDFDGDVQVTLTASALDHADGTATLTITDHEQSENLVYSFTMRGTCYGAGAVPLTGNGYLLLDLRNHRASAVVRWQDGNAERIDFPGWYTADIGASNIWVLHMSDVEAVPVATGEYYYGHMFGNVHPSEVPLGGGVTGPAVVSFAGPWRAGAPNVQPTIVEMGDMSARFDYERTKQENTSNTPFEVLLGELATDAGIQLPAFNSKAEPEATVIPGLNSTGIACYNLTWSGVNAGENAVQSFSYPGYLLLDLATGEMQALLAWRQGTQWYYTVENWREGASFAYPLTVAASTYSFLGGREDLLGFRFMYGANSTLRIGLPSNQLQTLPMSLSGNSWGHSSLDEENGIFMQSTITCGINAMTLTINQESMTIDQAMGHVSATLNGFSRVD